LISHFLHRCESEIEGRIEEEQKGRFAHKVPQDPEDGFGRARKEATANLRKHYSLLLWMCARSRTRYGEVSSLSPSPILASLLLYLLHLYRSGS
jgi:hypothetical protein